MTDETSKFFQESVRDGLENMLEAANAINAGIAQARSKVPEAFFVDVLLPHIRRWVRNDPQAEPGYWMNVSGGPNNEIDVVDGNGALLFTVPPPFMPVPVSEAPPEPGKRFVTPFHLVKEQINMLDNGDRRGIIDIERGVADAFTPRPEDYEKAKYLKMYVAIYQRYELPMEELLGPQWKEVLDASPSIQSADSAAVQGKQQDGSDAEEEFIY